MGMGMGGVRWGIASLLVGLFAPMRAWSDPLPPGRVPPAPADPGAPAPAQSPGPAPTPSQMPAQPSHPPPGEASGPPANESPPPAPLPSAPRVEPQASPQPSPGLQYDGQPAPAAPWRKAPAAEPVEAQSEDVTWQVPDDAAVRCTPFINALLGGMTVSRRFDSGAYVGAEVGGFLGGHFRASLRAVFTFGVQQPTGIQLSNPEFYSIHSEKPALVWGGSLGFALYKSQGFVLSVTANFMRTDVGDFGNLVGLSLPFEWITRGAKRVGFEFGVLEAYGGETLGECGSMPGALPSFPAQRANPECDIGEVRAFDREKGSGVWLHMVLGLPYDTPDPVPVRADAR